jgi:hypothetical protein
MAIGPPNKAATWFGRVVWLGILANLALAIPTLIIPDRMLVLTGLPAVTPLLWTRFSAWLLILLSLLYIPGANDPYRYVATARLSVVSRLAGVLFFATQAAEYWMLGAFDFVFLVPEAILLTMALRHAPATDARFGAHGLSS